MIVTEEEYSFIHGMTMMCYAGVGDAHGRSVKEYTEDLKEVGERCNATIRGEGHIFPKYDVGEEYCLEEEYYRSLNKMQEHKLYELITNIHWDVTRERFEKEVLSFREDEVEKGYLSLLLKSVEEMVKDI